MTKSIKEVMMGVCHEHWNCDEPDCLQKKVNYEALKEIEAIISQQVIGENHYEEGMAGDDKIATKYTDYVLGEQRQALQTALYGKDEKQMATIIVNYDQEYSRRATVMGVELDEFEIRQLIENLQSALQAIQRRTN